ncbi:hypothetical protein ATE84_2501 [Aquimarina sp. MAR_2010_214]|uniref:hypothetical protein n=1 Tax=Aquimarina sp. MAR_2010_214 TaxID=1250026 RepID=UPI000C704909|nr:hypothetical protein [Aquimarina sp. MAR_2010_214]PKV50443.1 hypothetical protein ATE84_2501 [Aquimarina sp. MAR_2010_214]
MKKIDRKIREISEYKNIEQDKIIVGILEHLEVKYNLNEHHIEDQHIIKGIKKKIINALLQEPNQKKQLNQTTKYNDVFNLDRIEMSLLNDAWNELEARDEVYAEAYEIGLTDSGIRKHRQEFIV